MKNRIVLVLSLIGAISLVALNSWAGKLVVVKDMVNVRQEATTKSAIVARLNKGHIIEELQKQGRWFEVEIPGEKKRSGWIYESLLKTYLAQEMEISPELARMADVMLSVDEMASVLDLLDPAIQENLRKHPEVMQRVIREELVRKVVIKEALDSGFDKDPLVARLMERSKSQTLADHFLNQQAQSKDNLPSEEDIAAFYKENIAEYTTPEKLHVGQLFIAVAMDLDKDAALKLADKANELAKLSGQEGENFSEVVKKFSEHRPTAEKGGDIGWVEKKALLPEVRDILTAMSVGEVSAPVRSNQGWHIFKLLDRKDEVVWPLSEVAGAIRETLHLKQLEASRKDYISELINRQPITIDQQTFDKNFSN